MNFSHITSVCNIQCYPSPVLFLCSSSLLLSSLILSYPLLSSSPAGTQLDSISVPGPHQNLATFKLLVIASALGPVRVDGKRSKRSPSSSPYPFTPTSFSSSSRYTILASATEGSVVLKSGVPQNHFVSKGVMEYFRFSASPDADLRYSVLYRTVYCSQLHSALL